MLLRRCFLFPLVLSTLFIFHIFILPSSSQGTNHSLLLNGTSAYVDVPYNAGLNITGALTMEAWVKTSSTAYQHVLERGDWWQAQMSYDLVVSEGKVRMDIMQSTGSYVSVTGNTTMSSGVWHHIAGVYDGSQMRVYLDGVLDGSAAATMTPGNNATGLRIGKSSFLYYPNYFNGRIDEVRVSNAALYNANFIPSVHLTATSSTKGLWKFDGQTTNDASSSAAHGVLQGSATYSTDVPTGTNSAPSVSITDPLNNTNFAAGANVVIDASASDSDGTVTQVEFFQGSTLLGSDSTAPYTFVWTSVPAGSYAISARATDDLGATTTSTPITITLNQAGGYRSVVFNGTSSYVDVPYNAGLNITGALTLEAWVKTTSTAYQHVIERGDWWQDKMSYDLTIAEGKVRLDIMQSNGSYATVIGTTAMSLNAWHHIAGVYDGSQMRVYLDGVLNGTAAATVTPGSNTTGLRIGKSSFLYYPNYFNGRIDEVRISNAALYSSNFTPNAHLAATSSTKGLWKFDGETTNDGSASGAHGSLQGGAAYSTDVPVGAGGGPQVPIAVANGPYNVQVGQAVSFSSSGSFDPDGAISSYHWNFGDGTSANTANPSHAFQNSGLFTATLTVTDNSGARASATAIVTVSGASEARLDPKNQTGGGGENPLSRNFNLNIPVLSLPGRAGMDLGLSLAHNSLVWTRNGSYISFDDDRGFPGPGFRLGFPVIQPLYYNAEVGKYAFLLISSDGSRTELRQVGTSQLYESADSSYLLLDASSMILRAADGTQLSYVLMNGEYNCTQIKDRNGNFITVNYTPFGRIDTVIDTLARSIKFNYDAGGSLTSITQAWNQNTPSQVTHTWATFTYSNTTIQTSFTGLNIYGPANNSTIKTLAKVTLADGSHTDFSYTSWGQVWQVSSFAPDNHLLNYRAYKLPGSPLLATSAQTDCPRFTERRDWAQYWNGDTDGIAAANEEAVTTFAEPVSDSWTMPDGTPQTGTRAQVTAPDGTSNRIYFIGAAATSSGWRRALPALVNTYDSAGVLQRQAMTTWTQDNTAVSYPLNPRVTETNVYDPAGNRARTQITYQQFTFANGTSCNLPRDVYEYAANATTILRSTRTVYNTSTAYSDRRILGLVSEKQLYEGEVNPATLMSKVGFFYDNENGASSIDGNDAPVQHDNTNYSASFVTGRANLSSVKRYDVTNTALFTMASSKFNTAGAVVSSRDASLHQTLVSYADSFSDGDNTRNTFAYPTTVTDPDGYSSTAKYQFDFGAMTNRRTPQPNTTSNLPGPEIGFAFDALGRLQQQTNLVNGAYARFEYAASQQRVDAYTTIQEGLGEFHSFTITDGVGRVIATAMDHPGSVGGFSGKKTVYDVMGRVIQTSNPTETSASGAPSQWVTAGDDAAAGWIYTEQTYDWKGRPLVTTNPSTTGNPADVTTKTFSYSGCGCAGGEIVTETDEGTLDGGVVRKRQRNVYSDVLGRTVKTEVLNWQGGSVYSTTVNSFNGRDQITSSKTYAGVSVADGSCPSGTCQETVTTYDGYARMKTRHVPQQNSGTSTVWDYNADDTIQKITDARGASQLISYNARRLITGISYSAPAPITVPVSLSFTYDAAGNRTTMSDELGSATYSYDPLSRLTSESRTFDAVGPLSLSYEYNLAGQLKKITDPANVAIAYTYDRAGRNTAITGENTLYGGVSQYASNMAYRAWGALKGMTYGNNYTMGLTYNARLLPSQFEVVKPTQLGSTSAMKTQYQYHRDGSVKFADRFTFDGFDRAFAYDHTGVLKEAYSGGEARDYVNGTSGGGSGPYRQTYQHNVFGNLTNRTGNYWSTPDQFSATYVNNRNQDPAWEFDADGRLKQDGTLQYKYDAAGRNRSVFDPSTNATTTLLADGDGRQIKRNDALPGSSVNTYYVRSSVLDGRIIAEVGANGQKSKGYVFAGGELLAVQQSNSVSWQHADPITGSAARSVQNGTFTRTTELDPSGVNVGMATPAPTNAASEFSPSWIPALIADEASCGSNPNCVRCAFLGSNIGCTMAANLIRAGVAMVDPEATPPSALKALAAQPIYGEFCVDNPIGVTGTPPGTPAGGSTGTAIGGAAAQATPTGRQCTTEIVGYDSGNLASEMHLVPLQGKKPIIDEKMLEDALRECIPELYPMFRFVSLVITTPTSDGVIRIRDAHNGTEANLINDSTPPKDVVADIKDNGGRGRNDSVNPWWTYSIASSNSPELRPGEKRYPDLYLAPKMDWFRTQIHETGAVLTYLRNRYYRTAYLPFPSDLHREHDDDGPAMEDCVGEKVYAKLGLKPVKNVTH